MRAVRLARSREAVLLVAVTLLVGTGGVLSLVGGGGAKVLWAAATVVALGPSVVWVMADLRARRWGADLLAVLALAATLPVGEYLAGGIVALMVATGHVLEAGARRRAGRDLSMLLDRAPSRTHRRTADGLETIGVDEVVAGQAIVVLPGEVVSVDGVLDADGAFDESALTGEPLPVPKRAGATVHSGTVNAGAAVDLVATAAAGESTYAGIVRLAERAVAGTAPVARIADRIAIWFLPVALLMAAAAWLFTGDAVRAVAVLVTATPCPLLLAVPIAVTAGMSRMSRAGVVVKDGAALETLGNVRVLLLDKTGTVSEGRPEVTDVVCAPGMTEERVLALAASVERLSPHVLAAAIVRAAAAAGVPVERAQDVTETPGTGVRGVVDGRRVTVGRLPGERDLPGWARGVLNRGKLDLASVVWVDVDGALTAAFLVRDRVRRDAPRTMKRLREAGIREIRLVTGDRVDNAREVAATLGLDAVTAEVGPAEKVTSAENACRAGVTAFVGDGVNDAPALATADVGVAMGSYGATAATQVADAVILDDRLERLADAVETARRSRTLAVWSAVGGTVLSLGAMAAAASGLLLPVAGAVVQEAIDVVAILNALRALRGRTRRHDPRADELAARFSAEHERLAPARAAIRHAADALADGPTAASDAAVRRANRMVVERLLPHEVAEESELYPVLGAVRTAALSREHAEISRLSRRLGRHLAVAPGRIGADQVDDLRATLYGLDAVLNLHYAQEEEAFFSGKEDR
ncbi:heavy metal translocating P-type ATPase [Amycolatopsis sp. CA-230715]|uniref:heavy metal translocating P-type ATPase n=1 Tax=Amycolatopsis sp. CA-230715 TaxID=2745196 RepID=UPI001C014091|nr:heavy metal translocating P-type ATPase [Amycolatopsis sp. CA-230715]QWF77957.1 Potassium-transporting ATPase ATP-binding subunit [Amycolatopsis sp. CA-230715]